MWRGSGFWVPVLGVLHSSSPQVEVEFRVIISGFWVLFRVERDKKSVKNFEQIPICPILLEIFRWLRRVSRYTSEVIRGCAAVVPLVCRWRRGVIAGWRLVGGTSLPLFKKVHHKILILPPWFESVPRLVPL